MSDVTSTFNSLSSTESSNSPSGATVIGSGLAPNLRMIQALLAAHRDETGWGGINLTSVAGSGNTITATVATAGSVTYGPTALTSGMRFFFTPASTSTGAVNIAITSPNGGSSLGVKNIFNNGVACIGGELLPTVPVVIQYDGTQFNIVGTPASTGVTASTFTFNGSGGTTSSVNLTWQKTGNFVALNIPILSGTTGTNSNTLSSNTNLPTAIRPVSQQRQQATNIEDNGVAAGVGGFWTITAGGQIQLARDGGPTSWTNSSTCGTMQNQTITYYIGA